MAKKKLWVWIALLSFLFTFAVNGYANYAPLNGLQTGEISDMFDVFFVPAGYVFAIWGVIYLLLFIFLIYQLLPSQKDSTILAEIGPYFLLANLSNAAWLVLFHYLQHTFTIIAMLMLLISLMAIYIRLRAKILEGKDRFLVQLPFSVYLGWVSVATIANATQFLYHVGWDGFGLTGEIWLVIVLIVAVLISWLMSRKFKDLAYALVLVWAFIGIGVRFTGNALVAYSSYAAAGLVLVLYVLSLVRKK